MTGHIAYAFLTALVSAAATSGQGLSAIIFWSVIGFTVGFACGAFVYGRDERRASGR